MDTLLDAIKEENDIKKIEEKEYPRLAKEIRQFLLEHISKSGGHLASNLGVVELTMALHAVLRFPQDKLIFDVGHQAYTHKILTGRKEEFDTLRKLNGLSGFPKKDESPCDCFETGHSSTSISAALGFAQARDRKGTKETVVAVIGDGALSGGMAFEALNNAARLKSNLIIVLNDNNMSISKNVGGMSHYLNSIRTGPFYEEFKGGVERTLLNIPKVGEPLAHMIKRSKDAVKQFFVPGMFFEEMGLKYVGPIDGHNINELIETLNKVKKLNRPVLLHVITKKGKGYKKAEKYPAHFHGVDSFDLSSGKSFKKKTTTYTEVFSKTLIEEAKTKEDIVAVSAAMPLGTGLSAFEKEFPNRFYDVGIAEEHAVTFAAGMAASGLKPVVAIYSSFLQRAYDQILHDVCIQNLPVVFAIDRSGLVGADGKTHQGIFDVSFLSHIPNMTIMAPMNGKELSKMLKYALSYEGPIAIKYPRGTSGTEYEDKVSEIEYGKGIYLEKGEEIALICVGHMLEEGKKVYEELKKKGRSVTLVNPRFIKPLDTTLIDELMKSHSLICTIEEGISQGGYGQMVGNYLMKQKWYHSFLPIAIADEFVPQGTIAELRQQLGIDAKAITEKILNELQRNED